MIGSFLTRGLVYVTLQLNSCILFDFVGLLLLLLLVVEIQLLCNVLAEWFLAMLIQLTSATKPLKRTGPRLSIFAFGASTGML